MKKTFCPHCGYFTRGLLGTRICWECGGTQVRMRRSSAAVLLTIGERDYHVPLTGYRPGCPPSWEDPGEGPEVELGAFVEVTGAKSGSEMVTYETFQLELAYELGLSLDEAEDLIISRAVERVEALIADDYD